MSYWLNRYLTNKPYQIVQIGSHDGVSGDPLYKEIQINTQWNVCLKNYIFSFENAAINWRITTLLCAK